MNQVLRELAQDCLTVSSVIRQRSNDVGQMATDNPYPYDLVLMKIAQQDLEWAQKVDEIMVGIIALLGDSPE